MVLSEIKSGQRCVVKHILATEKLLNKLLDMGFINGAVVEMIREAPLYDPMELKIHGYLISLRKSEANLIEVDMK